MWLFKRYIRHVRPQGLIIWMGPSTFRVLGIGCSQAGGHLTAIIMHTYSVCVVSGKGQMNTVQFVFINENTFERKRLKKEIYLPKSHKSSHAIVYC